MKKKVLLFAAMCCMLALPVFGQVQSTIRPGQPAKAIFIAMDSMDQHWLKLTQGCIAAAQKAKIQFTNNAPAGKTDAAQQVAMVEDAITAKYDVILLAPLNAQALIPVVNKAKAAGIKVVLVDSALGAGANYDTLISTDNKAAARMAADAMAKEVGGKGKIAIVNSQAGAGTTMDRENAFKDQMKNKYPNITIVDTQYSDGDTNKAMNIATDLMRKNPDLAGIYACNEGSSKGVGQAVKQTGNAGKVKVIGFDLSPEITALIKDSTMQGTMVQNPAAMGTKGIEAGVALLSGKAVQKDVDSGVTLGTKANVDKLQ